MIVTDLNSRERRKYAEAAIALTDAATRLAELLKAGNDKEALVALVVAGLAWRSLSELTEVFMAAANVDIPDGPPS